VNFQTDSERHAEAFAAATPFAHVVIDDFLPSDVAERVAESFPSLDSVAWRLEGPGDSKHSGDPEIEKVTIGDEEKFPPFIRHMMGQFQSGIFCRFLDRLTGFNMLHPDPNHFGCGLHSTGRGGRLMLHIDASRHPDKRMHQLINVIYYCSPGWKPEWGGTLELWNADATACVARVEPLFNRLLVFYTGGKSWHGHPNPVTAPPGKRRNSLALYYYSTDPSLSDIDYTNYVQWKAVTEHDRPSALHRVKGAIRALLPPAMVNEVARLARKTGLNFKK
jgi:hypothetical protein